jgi:PPM family protein phosphatase
MLKNFVNSVKSIINRPEILIGYAQILGKRKEQEDSFATFNNDFGVLGVLADGMGGYSNGKMASSTVVNAFVSEFAKIGNPESLEDFFINTANLSYSKVCEKGKGIKTGTTLVSVIIHDKNLYWTSIGDSAILLFSNGELINLNKKHIFQAILEKEYVMGNITKEEMINNPKKKRLTSFLGYDGFRDIDICKKPIQMRRGDKVIICSDGVYNSLTEIELETVLIRNNPPMKTTAEIMEMIETKNLPDQDNATIVILEKR